MNERLNGSKCLQEKIGQCMGCEINTMTREKSKINPNNAVVIAKRIQVALCPKNSTMQAIEYQKPSIW